MYNNFQEHLTKELAGIKEAGLFKNERILVSPQGAEITISSGAKVLNFCANNYLGLSNNPQLVAAAKQALDTHGYGMSSVRFICGTGALHKELEKKIADFFGMEETISVSYTHLDVYKRQTYNDANHFRIRSHNCQSHSQGITGIYQPGTTGKP